MNEDKTLTLGQIQKILDTPQYTLIHLCEKGVVVPDFSDADGRGKSRLFSLRNLGEFAIALHIRKLQIPVLTTKAIMIVLKKIENRVKKEAPHFSLLDFGKKNHTQLTIYVEETENVIFSFFSPRSNRPAIMKCLVPSFSQLLAKKGKLQYLELEKLPDDYSVRLEINVSRIFANLKHLQ